jgi:hypothetical protein
VSSIPAGRRFREAWIAGVTAHFPGDPKPGYITPWDDTPDWERACAAAVEYQVLDFISVTAGATTKLTREQKGRFVALCWIGQIHRHIDNPKPAYTPTGQTCPHGSRKPTRTSSKPSNAQPDVQATSPDPRDPGTLLPDFVG